MTLKGVIDFGAHTLTRPVHTALSAEVMELVIRKSEEIVKYIFAEDMKIKYGELVRCLERLTLWMKKSKSEKCNLPYDKQKEYNDIF